MRAHRYLVLTDLPEIVHITDDLEEAKRECAEWAEYDDITVAVFKLKKSGKGYKEVFKVRGFAEAAEILDEGILTVDIESPKELM